MYTNFLHFIDVTETVFSLQNSSFKTSTYSNITESKDIRTEKICSEYLSVIQNLSELLQEDPKSEVLPSVILNS